MLDRIFIVVLVILATAAAGIDVPEEWKTASAAGDLVYAKSLPKDVRFAPSVGNGYLSANPFTDTLYLSGLFNGFAGGVTTTHRARIPFQLSLAPDASALYDSDSSLFALNVREACVISMYSVLLDGCSKPATAKFTWFTPRQSSLMHVAVLDVEIDARKCPQINSNLTLKVSLTNGTASKELTVDNEKRTGDGVITVSAHIKHAEYSGAPIPSLATSYTEIPSVLSFPSGSLSSWRFVQAVRSDIDGSSKTDLPQLAEMAVYKALGNGDTVFQEHKAEWATLWNSGIEVGGSDDALELALVVNTSLYYILSSVRDDWPFGLSPGSLSSDAYDGHEFWDTEMWMMPTLTLLHPSITKSLLNYRVVREEGARSKASEHGYDGFQYPWESAFTGVESCRMVVGMADREIHISADIAIGVFQYWNITGDDSFMRSSLLPMVSGINKYFMSRMTYDDKSDSNWIIDVIPPDEYVLHCNNSAFTNGAVQRSLYLEADARERLNEDPQYALTLRSVAEKIRIPFDSTKEIHLEHDSYTGDLIKQADVVLLGYPVQMPMPVSVRRNDLVYYAQRVDSNGPAMSHSMHAVAWLELGDEGSAEPEFRNSYALNVRGDFKVWAEESKTQLGGAVNFITGAGGFLQALWAGYGRLRIEHGTVSARPLLPPDAKIMKLRRTSILGVGIDVSVSREGVTVKLSSSTTAPPLQLCVITDDGTKTPLTDSSVTVSVPYGQQFTMQQC